MKNRNKDCFCCFLLYDNRKKEMSNKIKETNTIQKIKDPRNLTNKNGDNNVSD